MAVFLFFSPKGGDGRGRLFVYIIVRWEAVFIVLVGLCVCWLAWWLVFDGGLTLICCKDVVIIGSVGVRIRDG